MMCDVLRVSDCVSTVYSSRYARSSVLLLVILRLRWLLLSALVGVPYLSSWWSSMQAFFGGTQCTGLCFCYYEYSMILRDDM